MPEPRNNLAVLYAQKGEYALARDELERAIQTAPDYAVAHENLGDVYARLAEVEYEKTMALDRRNRTAGPEAEADSRSLVGREMKLGQPSGRSTLRRIAPPNRNRTELPDAASPVV